jgi:hypothetical protein
MSLSLRICLSISLLLLLLPCATISILLTCPQVGLLTWRTVSWVESLSVNSRRELISLSLGNYGWLSALTDVSFLFRAPAPRPLSWTPLPPNFELPHGGMLQTIQLWFLGNPSAAVPPLRTLQPQHLGGNKSQRKRLSALCLLMKEIERLARLASVWVDAPTPEQVILSFLLRMCSHPPCR